MSVLLVVAIAISFGGCREDLGVELPPDVQRTEVKYAEFDLDINSVYLDSLRTDKAGVVLAGSFTEPKLGKVETTGFAEFNYSSGFIANDFIWVRETGRTDSLAEITFEKMEVNLRINEVFTNEFFIDQQLELWALTDSIFNTGIYLSNRTIGTSDLVGTAQIDIPNLNPVDFAEDTVVVNVELSQSYGESFLADFKKYGVDFRPLGLAFKSTNGNQLVSYDILDDTTEVIFTMRANVYDTAGIATLTGDTLITTTFKFSSFNHFTGVVRDRSGSAIATAQDSEIIDIDPDYAYISPTAGIYPKIELDEFREFAEMESNILFNRVELRYDTEDYVGHLEPIYAMLYYLTKDNANKISVDWPAILSFPDKFNVLMQSDASITRQRDLPEYHYFDTLSTTTIGYKGTPTLFFQYHYNNIRDDLDNIKDDRRTLLQQWMLDVDDLLIKNVESLPTGRQAIPKNSLKLRIYYSQKR